MKNKKLFATDFDGTFNQYPNGVTEECLKAVSDFRKEGNIFGIITGRSYENTNDIRRHYAKYCDFMACMTGAYVEASDGSVIINTEGDGNALFPILEAIMQFECRYLLYNDGKHSFAIDVSKPLTAESAEYREILNHSTFSQVNAGLCDNGQIAKLSDKLMSLWKDKISIHVNGTCLDIPPAGVSKGAAVGKIAEYFGVSKDNIYTAGDNDNDLSMISAYHGFTLPYGSEKCRENAEGIYGDVGEMLRAVMGE